uniref:ODAD1 central coiled coil region domain-containing protein n=1 Tax=Palpitomonas bilix TaxID=652834 RepID=A0A7S3CVC0_9EUKA
MRKELQLEAAGDLSAEGEDNLKKSLYTSAFHHAVNESKLEEEQEKITTYEDAFRKIKDATGVSDVNEVIQKFLTQDTTRGNLRNMTKEAQSKIDQLNDERTQLKAKVEEIKYSGTGSLGSRRIVDEFETQLSDANAKLERNRQKYERIARILIDVKAGIEHLSDKLESVKIDAAPIPLTDETLVEVLLQAEQKLIKLVEAVNVEEEGAGDVEGDSIKATAALAEKSYTSTAHEVNLPEFNVRIPLSQATEVGEDASDSDGDDEGDEVPDRSEVKQYSAMLLEKANKKPKKGKKKKSNAPAGMGSRSVSRGKKGGQDFD